MSLALKILGRIFSTICTISVAHGVLLWLDAQYHIKPDVGVADMLGYATSPGAVDALRWVILGFSGLGGLGIWVAVERRIDRARKTERQKAEERRAQRPDLSILSVMDIAKRSTECGPYDDGRILDYLRQEAVLGNITVWGTERYDIDVGVVVNELYEEIPREYWKPMKIDETFLQKDHGISRTARDNSVSFYNEQIYTAIYHLLRFSKVEINQIFHILPRFTYWSRKVKYSLWLPWFKLRQKVKKWRAGNT